MPGDAIMMAGQEFKIARDPKSGALLWKREPRASQRGDPGGMETAEWSVSGPDFFSYEDIEPGQVAGYLGRDYGDGTDGRWDGQDILGPAINAVTLTAYDVTWSASIPGTATFKPGVNLHLGAPPVATDVIDGTVATGPAGVPYLYLSRGSYPTKVSLNDMTLKRSGELLNAPAVGILATRTAAGVAEISVGMQATPYRVLTAIAAPPDPDAWESNDDGQFMERFFVAPDRIVGFYGQQVLGNILSGAVKMVSPNWNSVTALDGERVTLGGFAMDGALWVIGTSNGPYMLDGDTGRFFPIIDEIDNDDANGKLASWFPIGVVILLRSGLRQQRFGQGQSFGPERFFQNQSPIQGHAEAAAGSARYLYVVMHNHITGDYYLTAWHPRDPGDLHGNILSPHVIANLGANACEWLRFVGTVNGVRTNETLVGGRGTNMFYMLTGRSAREIDDTTYTYGLAGTTYLTELRRQPSLIKDFEVVEFESDDCLSTRTITLGFQVDGGSWNTLSGSRDYPTTGATKNGVVNTNGFQRLLLADDSAKPHSWASGRRIKPRITYASASSSVSPTVVGTLRVSYRTRPLVVDAFAFAVELPDNDPALTSRELADQLRDALGGGPVLVDEDPDGYAKYYLRVEAIEVSDVEARPSTASGGNPRRMATVRATSWQT